MDVLLKIISLTLRAGERPSCFFFFSSVFSSRLFSSVFFFSFFFFSSGTCIQTDGLLRPPPAHTQEPRALHMPAAGADLARWLHAELQTLKLAKLRAEERQLALVGEVELLQEQMGRTGEVLSEFGARADDCSRELVSRRARNQRLASDYVHLRERVPDDSAVDTLALESVVDQMRALTDEKIALIDERSKLQGRLKHSEDTIVQNRHTHETLVQAVHMQSSVSAALVGKSEENMQLSFARAAQQQEEQEQQVEQQWERAAPDDRQLAAPLSQQQPFLKRFDLQTERLALLGPMGKEHSPARGSMSRTAVTNSKTVDVQAASIASAAIAAT